MPNSCIYCRVDKDAGYSVLLNQRRLLEEYAIQHGYSVVWIIIEEWCGADCHRPGLTELCHIAENGCIDNILVFSSNQLGRNSFLTYRFLGFLDRLGIQLISVKEGVVDNALAMSFPFPKKYVPPFPFDSIYMAEN